MGAKRDIARADKQGRVMLGQVAAGRHYLATKSEEGTITLEPVGIVRHPGPLLEEAHLAIRDWVMNEQDQLGRVKRARRMADALAALITAVTLSGGAS